MLQRLVQDTTKKVLSDDDSFSLNLDFDGRYFFYEADTLWSFISNHDQDYPSQITSKNSKIQPIRDSLSQKEKFPNGKAIPELVLL